MMEAFIFAFCIFAAFAVPFCVMATVQYCVHINKEMGFAKLLIFSWSLALIFMPFSFGFSCKLISSLIAGEVSNCYGVYALAYSVFGWLICSAIYGKLIVPRFAEREIKLP